MRLHSSVRSHRPGSEPLLRLQPPEPQDSPAEERLPLAMELQLLPRVQEQFYAPEPVAGSLPAFLFLQCRNRNLR